jgi:transposase InsO family protein
MDNSATPFQKPQALCKTSYEATASSPRVNYDQSSTNLLELIVVLDKESRTVARAFDRSWLCHYSRPLICLHNKGTKFTGIEFQEILQSYGIKAVIATTANPQTNVILERTHQVIANQL